MGRGREGEREKRGKEVREFGRQQKKRGKRKKRTREREREGEREDGLLGDKIKVATHDARSQISFKRKWSLLNQKINHYNKFSKKSSKLFIMQSNEMDRGVVLKTVFIV